MVSPSSGVDVKQQLEALLFASGKAMSTQALIDLSKLDRAKVTRALKALQKEYADRGGAIEINNDGETWKMTVRSAHVPLVKGLVADTELSRACMETLAVIAYKHPNAVQSEVIDTRGSGAYEHIAELERLGFVRKEPFSRSYKLKLTEKFFNYFDVGEKGIKTLFGEIQLPEKQQTLGDLEVVGVEKDHPNPTGELEVVPVGKHPAGHPHAQKQAMQTPQEFSPVAGGVAAPTPVLQDEAHLAFLKDLDERIKNITNRNDDHANDPLYKSKLPQGEELETADEISEDNAEQKES